MRLVEDEVDVERGKHADGGAKVSLDDLAAAVFLVAGHVLEQAVVEALNADGQPGDTRGAERLEDLGAQVLGVGLDGDVLHAEQLADEVERGDELAGFGRGRTAADVDPGEAETGGVVAADFLAERRKVALGLAVVVLDAVERAERAEHLTERHVDVEVAVSLARRGRHGARGFFHAEKPARPEAEGPEEEGINEREREHGSKLAPIGPGFEDRNAVRFGNLCAYLALEVFARCAGGGKAYRERHEGEVPPGRPAGDAGPPGPSHDAPPTHDRGPRASSAHRPRAAPGNGVFPHDGGVREGPPVAMPSISRPSSNAVSRRNCWMKNWHRFSYAL